MTGVFSKIGGDFWPRLWSALVIAVVALTVMRIGGWAMAVFGALATGVMIWEWRGIVGAIGRWSAFGAALIAVLAPLVVHGVGVGAALLVILLAAVATFLAHPARTRRWMTLGVVILALAASAFVWLRDYEPFGFYSVLWVALVVAATDVGAYFAGRLIGGPKLAPRLSPKKTWAGLGGGMGLAALAGAGFAVMTGMAPAFQVAVVSMLAAIVAQAGDLAESALKRKFGVKDASNLIPGHGGVMDRADGLMAVTFAAALLTFLRNEQVFIW